MAGSSEKGSRIIRICESGMRVVLVGMMMMSSTTSSVVVLMDPKISSTPTSTSSTTFMTLLRSRIQSWLSSPPYPFIAMILILLLLIIINILVSSSPSPLSSGLSEEFTLESSYYNSPQEIWSEEGKGSAAGDHGEVVGGGGEDEYQSLEETWKAITNGPGVPPPAAAAATGTRTTTTTRLQKVMISKFETWRDMLPPQPPPCGGGSSSSSRREKMMKTSNTFVEGGRRCTSGYRRKGGDELILLSQDELNKRVEEFIRKCKNKMRLERLESDEHKLASFMDGYSF